MRKKSSRASREALFDVSADYAAGTCPQKSLLGNHDMGMIALELVRAFPRYISISELQKKYANSQTKDRIRWFGQGPGTGQWPKTFEAEYSEDRQSIRVKLLNPNALLEPYKPAPDDEPMPDIVYPDEVSPEETYTEGSVRRVAVNAYERNPDARNRCIAYYGAKCVICEFDFEKAYGVVKGFIHVHHLQKLSAIGREYRVDPISDLRPVCPNCHAIIHLKKQPFTIEEVRAMIGRARSIRNDGAPRRQSGRTL